MERYVWYATIYVKYVYVYAHFNHLCKYIYISVYVLHTYIFVTDNIALSQRVLKN